MSADIKIYGCRTPMLQRWSDANLDYVEISLYAYAGSPASNVSPSTPASSQYEFKVPEVGGYCDIDIAPFMRDFIERRHFTDNRFYYADLYVRKTISGSTGTWFRQFQILVGTGYNYSHQRENDGEVIEIFAGDSARLIRSIHKYFLTDAPYLDWPVGATAQIPVKFEDFGDGTSSGGDTRFTEFKDNQMANPNTGPALGDSPQNFQSRYTSSYSTDKTYSFPGTIDTLVSWVAVQQISSNSYFNVLEKLQIKRRCTGGLTAAGGDAIPERYTKIIFINKYGVREVIFFYGARTKETIADRKMVDRTKRVGATHDRYAPMTAMRIGEVKERWTINTGWYTHEFREVFRQLMLSEQIWIFQNEKNATDGGATHPWQPFNLISTDFKTENIDKDRLVNYSFTFELADDLIAGTI